MPDTLRGYILVSILTVLGVCGSQKGLAQFSPGDLSRAHEKLEGMNNCLECHETGNEISGKKCQTCHQEIMSMIGSRHGFHFRNASKQCIACHKEHLGRDAQTMQFDKNTFDHAQTGFPRLGKHAAIKCEDCHAKKNIKDAQALKVVDANGRKTFLGLHQSCVSCHADRHNNTVGKECQTCHSAKAWSPAEMFDHGKTDYALVGKHAPVACNKCHTDLDHKEKGKPVLFATKEFTDCTPCHVSPHSDKFVKQECTSCHSPEGWNTPRQNGKFNHDQTAFKLVGRHAAVTCEKCHKPSPKGVPGRRLKLAYNRCTNCHADYHQGMFGARYGNDCVACHSPAGFRPSSFTLAAHRDSRFPLSGAHVAIPCEKCHTRKEGVPTLMRFVNLRCEACHKDKHGGQFAREMVEKSCAACHSAEDWFPRSFDHSRTQFALSGKHVQTKCEKCHKEKSVKGVMVAQYKGVSTKCESCHQDVHVGQFAVRAETDCAPCHQPEGWKVLVFDHNKQSVFELSGAHKRTECRQCHKDERRGETTFVRFKPVPTKCESCHA